MVTVAWRDDTGGVVGSCIDVHVVTVIVAIIQVRITMAGIRASPCIMVVVVVTGASESRRVARSGATYPILITLLTSH